MEDYANELDRKKAKKRNKKIAFCGGIKAPKLISNNKKEKEEKK